MFNSNSLSIVFNLAKSCLLFLTKQTFFNFPAFCSILIFINSRRAFFINCLSSTADLVCNSLSSFFFIFYSSEQGSRRRRGSYASSLINLVLTGSLSAAPSIAFWAISLGTPANSNKILPGVTTAT